MQTFENYIFFLKGKENNILSFFWVFCITIFPEKATK